MINRESLVFLPNEFIDISIYNTRLCVPFQWHLQFLYMNCYPGVIPGKAAYGGPGEQRGQALMIQYLRQKKTPFLLILERV